MVSIPAMEKRQAFHAGLVTGAVHFLSLLYWIVPTIRVYGGVPLVLAVPVLALLALYLALYVALFSGGLKLFPPSSPWMPFGAGALWVGAEYLRASLFTGFPWGALGYSQYTNLPLIQVADMAGVYGVSYVVVAVNGCFALVWRSWKKGARLSRLGLTVVPVIVMVILVVGYGLVRQETVRKAMADATGTKVSVVQGNISQAVKWDQAYKESTVDAYCRLSRQAGAEAPDLVVWPETALPFYYGREKSLSDRVDRCIRDTGASFLVGSPALGEKNSSYTYYNRAYMFNRFSIVTGWYDKVHLVPFGEYVPLGRYLPFLGKITASAGDFSPGSRGAGPLGFGGDASAGVLTCFEVIFPSLARKMVARGGGILVTITNDAWFGYTSAPEQHFSMAVFRAVENRRPVARAANTGISGFIDPRGRIMAATGLYTEAVRTRTLPLVKIKTLYSVAGDWFAVICFVAITLVFMVKRRLGR
ncbi:MAG: apolipoprotein N-acyltransferase [Desulfobacteraceae bacterium]|nr:apolipoprotein N-acyltransferase [Desulfobacteraceae bacterium]